MRTSFVATTLAAVASVSGRALPQQAPGGDLAAPLPINTYKEQPHIVKPVPLEVAAQKFKNLTGAIIPEVLSVLPPSIVDKLTKDLPLPTPSADPLSTRGNFLAARDDVIEARGSCQNPRVRVEWDYMSNNDKQSFVSAIQCLMSRPSSGRWGNSRSRYEDFVALHQALTPNVHGNAKFIIWHRYFLWTFESIMRSECGFNTAFPWWDETRYAGNFGASSVFQWFGTSNSGSGCVTDGAFGGLTLDVGPGTYNQLNPHCLQRETDESATANVNSAYVNQCAAWGDYANMAACSEGGPHAWGHNGIGGVMADMFASPGDPVFWLHHAFVDRNFRIWQNADSSRTQNINGNDVNGNPLTMGMSVNVYDMRPTVRIGDIMDTTNPTLCYKYNY